MIKKFTTPIDFDALVSVGALEKVGRRWRIKDRQRLPDYVIAQIVEVQDGGFVKFCKPSKNLQKLAQKLSL